MHAPHKYFHIETLILTAFDYHNFNVTQGMVLKYKKKELFVLRLLKINIFVSEIILKQQNYGI